MFLSSCAHRVYQGPTNELVRECKGEPRQNPLQDLERCTGKHIPIQHQLDKRRQAEENTRPQISLYSARVYSEYLSSHTSSPPSRTCLVYRFSMTETDGGGWGSSIPNREAPGKHHTVLAQGSQPHGQYYRPVTSREASVTEMCYAHCCRQPLSRRLDCWE